MMLSAETDQYNTVLIQSCSFCHSLMNGTEINLWIVCVIAMTTQLLVIGADRTWWSRVVHTVSQSRLDLSIGQQHFVWLLPQMESDRWPLHVEPWSCPDWQSRDLIFEVLREQERNDPLVPDVIHQAITVPQFIIALYRVDWTETSFWDQSGNASPGRHINTILSVSAKIAFDFMYYAHALCWSYAVDVSWPSHQYWALGLHNRFALD